MPIIKKVKRCYHCGAILQDKNIDLDGYIDSDTLKKYPNGLLLCNNCFDNEKINSPQEANLDEEFPKILDQIKDSNALVVYVVDLFSFEGSFIKKVNEKFKGCDVLAIGNKRDLLPVNVDDRDLLEYVEHRLRVAQLDVKDVVLTSSTIGYNLDLMFEKILKLSKGRDVYFVGSSVSGKSALIAEFLKKYKNNTKEFIVTYTFPGTNLRGFKIPIDKKKYIYETPGLSIDNSILYQVELMVAHKIMPDNVVLPRKYNLTKGNSLILGGLCLIELMSGEKTKVDLYVNDLIQVKIAKNGESNFASILSRHSLQPCSQRIISFADFDVYDFKITENGDRDIGILGLGWMHFIGNSQTFRIFVPKGVYVYTTRSKIK